MQLLTAFVMTSVGLSRACPDINDCFLETMADAFRWWYLGLCVAFSALAYGGVKYCDRMAPTQALRTPEEL
ncbi:hypothetical protein [Povalibacter sp.]|uniref:hypothetical protein n=1 Tax=Povalibacter sp. TaxID=1962978 RepID=UPI002F3FB94A